MKYFLFIILVYSSMFMNSSGITHAETGFLTNTGVLIAVVDSPLTVTIQGTNFDGNEAIRITGARCRLGSIRFYGEYFTQSCTGYQIGRHKISVYDRLYDLDIETPSAYEYVEFVLVDKTNVTEFHKQYGWWTDYIVPSKISAARSVRRFVNAKAELREERIINTFQKRTKYSEKTIFQTKEILAQNEKQHMDEYYKKLLPYVISEKRDGFRAFVDGAIEENTKSQYLKVDEIVSQKKNMDFSEI